MTTPQRRQSFSSASSASSSSTATTNNNNANDDSDSPISLNELLYSTGSYHAIARPVSITMMLAALAAVFVNDESTLESTQEQFSSAYNVFDLDDSGSKNAGVKNLAMSIGNAFIIVLVIAAMTFGIVLLYKFRCMKLLIGYMIFSSASLLGFLGYYMGSIAINIYNIPIDTISYFLIIYNFAVVGVAAIFFQRGIPPKITQMYLICTAVILAWHLSHFDDWTAWTLLVMLALYDLCAVLTPCGPLKALVNLMSERDAPDMPGLLYEAQLPAGTQRPGGAAAAAGRQGESSSERAGPVGEQGGTATNAQEEQSTGPLTSLPSAMESIGSSMEEEEEETSPSLVPGGGLGTLSGEEAPLSPQTRRVSIPLAIARIYKLPPTTTYGTPSLGSQDDESRSTPFLAHCSPEEYYLREFTVEELVADVEVELPQAGGRIVKQSSGRKAKYLIYGRDGDLRRTLVVNKKGKVFEVTRENDDGDDESEYEESTSIRLGLGDFIFYSVLVAKAAMYGFATFASCMLVILAGLGGTLVLLSVYHSALPALPISIFLGVVFYLLTRLLIEPWVEAIMMSPLYI